MPSGRRATPNNPQMQMRQNAFYATDFEAMLIIRKTDSKKKSTANCDAFESEADGTRTRDLRRDRPLL